MSKSSRRKSRLQRDVEAFMAKAKQRVPQHPAEPTEAERLRCIRVITEEWLELVKGFGVAIKVTPPTVPPPRTPFLLQMKDLTFEASPIGFDMVQAVDGAIDTEYTLICALSACGIADEEIRELVSKSNLAKFGPGHYFREDGKLMKPPGFRPPDIAAAIRRQAKECGVAPPLKSPKTSRKKSPVKASLKQHQRKLAASSKK